MLVLKPNEVCPYSTSCPHNQDGTCFGSRSDRNNQFNCSLVDNNGTFSESTNIQRNPYDKTGNMKIIME